MVTTIYNGFQWKLWRKIMGKTFEEWFEEIFDDLEDWNPYDLMKKAWDASRQNMTTRDI